MFPKTPPALAVATGMEISELVAKSFPELSAASRQFARKRSPFQKPELITLPPGLIQRWEGAFYCNDTPFVDQVRFPLATLWGGRLKLVGFESDLTTANFVLGLPGGGTLPSLSMFGSGHLAMKTPPSDQIAGVHVTFSFRGGAVESIDNSGLRGVQTVVKASRSLLESLRLSGR